MSVARNPETTANASGTAAPEEEAPAAPSPPTADAGADHDRLCRLFLTGIRHCAVVLFDPDGRVLSWNAGAEQMYGREATDVLGRTFPGIDLLDRDIGPDGHLQRECWQRRADGTRFWAEIVLTRVCQDGGLRGYGALVRDITAGRRFQAELMRRALHDTLTGLPNRALLLDRMRKAIGRLERHTEPAAVYFVDLDGFKAVNDRLGHRAGDMVLTAVGERLRDAIRTNDTVARLSGDEFVVLCEGLTEEHDAAEIAARLVGALQAPLEFEDETLLLCASIGVAVLRRPGQDAEDVLDRADAAMYRAKRRADGERIQVVFSAPA
jgi:diguanylate cyclase (GGDEF)-like protein/PAS domain S-box-containing protein